MIFWSIFSFIRLRFCGQTEKPTHTPLKTWLIAACFDLKQVFRCWCMSSVLWSWPPASLSRFWSLGPLCHLHRHPLRLTLSTRRLHPPLILCLTFTCSARITHNFVRPPWSSSTKHSTWPLLSHHRPPSYIHHMHTMRQENTYLQL